MPSHPLKIWGSGSKWKGLYEISGPLHWLSSWRWWPPKRGVNCIGHCGGEEWAIWVKFVLQISQIAPCHVFTYNRANTRTSMLKNLTFPIYEFGKGQCAFYPQKLSRFAEKEIKFVWNTKIGKGQCAFYPQKLSCFAEKKIKFVWNTKIS